MAKTLFCPFCGAELDMCDRLYWSCTNRQCTIWSDMMPKSVWQALIDGKKAQDALKIATKKITYAQKGLSRIKDICEQNQTLDYKRKADIWANAHSTLNQMAIASITKQEKE